MCEMISKFIIVIIDGPTKPLAIQSVSDHP